jgi:hypothetical protein
MKILKKNKRVTAVFDCVKCNVEGAGLDKSFEKIEEIPTILKENCPVCDSDTSLELNKVASFKFYKTIIK